MNRSGACAGYSDTYPRDCPTSKMQFSIHPPSTTEATFGGFPRCAPNWSFVYSHTPSHRRPPFSHYFNYNSFCFASSEFRHMLDTPLIIDWSTDVDVTQTGKVMDVQAMQLGWSDANVAEHTTDTGGVNTMLTSIKHSRGFQPKARNQLICRLMFHVCNEDDDDTDDELDWYPNSGVRVILNAPSSGLCANGNRAIFGVEALHLSRVANAQRARPIKDNAAARRFTQANGVEPYKEIQTKREE
ncbi:uncharacterized protein EI90DRAFT_3017526 [Cantharellus anzutake]|uniref:uncharacterized protein n=1 Tax=Cantharellus anzutake TaxID=1750568 RepID=UPI001904D860|nr:uncharacterized protein EI90DRAFT_3017526 [Cantharellus anzutake]KAF8328655.1 hypothetical protein EI90DRAFT_3017526 [Cantharellus anzutake]